MNKAIVNQDNKKIINGKGKLLGKCGILKSNNILLQVLIHNSSFHELINNLFRAMLISLISINQISLYNLMLIIIIQ